MIGGGEPTDLGVRVGYAGVVECGDAFDTDGAAVDFNASDRR